MMATTTEDTVLLISSTEKSAEKAPTHAGSRSNHPSSSPPLDLHHTQRTIQPKRLPLGALLLERLGICSSRRTLLSYKIFVYALTFLCYMTYHLSRKPFSVVKVVLCPECVDGNSDANSSRNGWPPFEGKHAKTLLGSVDYAELFAYAVAMYFSGLVADRVNLRYFLTLGLIGSGLNVVLIGLAYFFQIHYLAYFLVVQVFGGVMQVNMYALTRPFPPRQVFGGVMQVYMYALTRPFTPRQVFGGVMQVCTHSPGHLHPDNT